MPRCLKVETHGNIALVMKSGNEPLGRHHLAQSSGLWYFTTRTAKSG